MNRVQSRIFGLKWMVRRDRHPLDDIAGACGKSQEDINGPRSRGREFYRTPVPEARDGLPDREHSRRDALR